MPVPKNLQTGRHLGPVIPLHDFAHVEPRSLNSNVVRPIAINNVNAFIWKNHAILILYSYFYVRESVKPYQDFCNILNFYHKCIYLPGLEVII